MKLVIKNFAKIKAADIALNGITVIAGENNSGKSTVGKLLGAVFHSFLCLDKVIYEHRLKNMASYFLKSVITVSCILDSPHDSEAIKRTSIPSSINCGDEISLTPPLCFLGGFGFGPGPGAGEGARPKSVGGKRILANDRLNPKLVLSVVSEICSLY